MKTIDARFEWTSVVTSRLNERPIMAYFGSQPAGQDVVVSPRELRADLDLDKTILTYQSWL